MPTSASPMPPPRARSCPRSSIARTKAQQPGRELSAAAATTRTGDAGVSISGRPAAVHRCLLRRPQSLRPAPFPSLRPFHPSSSPQRRGAMEGRGRRRRLSPFVQPRSLPRAPWSVNVTTPSCLWDVYLHRRVCKKQTNGWPASRRSAAARHGENLKGPTKLTLRPQV